MAGGRDRRVLMLVGAAGVLAVGVAAWFLFFAGGGSDGSGVVRGASRAHLPDAVDTPDRRCAAGDSRDVRGNHRDQPVQAVRRGARGVGIGGSVLDDRSRLVPTAPQSTWPNRRLASLDADRADADGNADPDADSDADDLPDAESQADQPDADHPQAGLGGLRRPDGDRLG